MMISENDIIEVEKILLPDGCHFNEEAKDVINCWTNKEILACPGSGKTTVLLAKLKLLVDHMPLTDGRGVCVLSHTNVAVDEIKGKLGESANKILGYPNFAGTIQTFVDKYIAFPFLKQVTDEPIRVVDRLDFSKALYAIINKKYEVLLRFIISRQKSFSGIYANTIAFLAALYSNNGDLYVKANGTPKILAGATTLSAQNYLNAVKDLLSEEGMIRYDDAYLYAQRALDEYGDYLSKLVSKRFKFVFVDEYQDCSKIQRNILEQLFAGGGAIFQKIGDVDQAIYGIDDEYASGWQVSSDSLMMTDTNRYGQEIADVLTKIRVTRKHINAIKGTTGIKPVLLVCDEKTRKNVISAFVEEIVSNRLNSPNGIYKVIGMYKNVRGVKISDYWENFQVETGNKEYCCYPDFIIRICREAQNGNLYKIEKEVRKLLCQIYHFHKIKPKNLKSSSTYNLSSMKQHISNEYADIYSRFILELTNLSDYDYCNVETHIKKFLFDLLGYDAIEKLPDWFLRNQEQRRMTNDKGNVFFHKEAGIMIHFDTVHGVKGETHDATLYLETEKSRGTDLKRIMPLLKNENIKQGAIYEKSRRCVYVGFSRPRSLLCVAVNNDLYEEYKKAFINWKVIDLTK